MSSVSLQPQLSLSYRVQRLRRLGFNKCQVLALQFRICWCRQYLTLEQQRLNRKGLACKCHGVLGCPAARLRAQSSKLRRHPTQADHKGITDKHSVQIYPGRQAAHYPSPKAAVLGQSLPRAALAFSIVNSVSFDMKGSDRAEAPNHCHRQAFLCSSLLR